MTTVADVPKCAVETIEIAWARWQVGNTWDRRQYTTCTQYCVTTMGRLTKAGLGRLTSSSWAAPVDIDMKPLLYGSRLTTVFVLVAARKHHSAYLVCCWHVGCKTTSFTVGITCFVPSLESTKLRGIKVNNYSQGGWRVKSYHPWHTPTLVKTGSLGAFVSVNIFRNYFEIL